MYYYKIIGQIECVVELEDELNLNNNLNDLVHEIFVNTKYDELKNQTILEAMNTLIESHSEEKATSIIRQKILENPFAY